MRATINGIRYDTETARQLAQYVMGKPHGDAPWLVQTLYQTPRSGALFIHAEGTAMVACTPERIIPRTVDEANAWARNRKLPIIITTTPKEA